MRLRSWSCWKYVTCKYEFSAPDPSTSGVACRGTPVYGKRILIIGCLFSRRPSPRNRQVQAIVVLLCWRRRPRRSVLMEES